MIEIIGAIVGIGMGVMIFTTLLVDNYGGEDDEQCINDERWTWLCWNIGSNCNR